MFSSFFRKSLQTVTVTATALAVGVLAFLTTVSPSQNPIKTANTQESYDQLLTSNLSDSNLATLPNLASDSNRSLEEKYTTLLPQLSFGGEPANANGLAKFGWEVVKGKMIDECIWQGRCVQGVQTGYEYGKQGYQNTQDYFYGMHNSFQNQWRNH